MPKSPERKKKTVTVSFRLDEEPFRAIEKDAESHKVSVNTFVNQLFEKYAAFDRYFERIGVQRISKPAYRRLVEVISDNDLADVAAKAVRDSARAMIVAKHGTITPSSILEYLRTWWEYGISAETNEVETQDGKRIFTVIHNNGMKVSFYFGECVRNVFELINVQPKITLTENALVVEVPERSLVT